MIAAAPRKKANGDTSIRPWRIGTSSGNARRGLLLEERDRIRARCGRLPVRMGAPGSRLAGSPASLGALRGRVRVRCAEARAVSTGGPC